MGLLGWPLFQLGQRDRADEAALQSWQQGGAAAAAGPAPSGAAAPAHAACGSPSSSDYALVTFPSLSQYGYAGVAGDGTWDDLHLRSMVHYTGTAAPGESGNSIIAFHREPAYEHIDQLKVGDVVDVQDRSCHTWSYRITQRWDLSPDAVTQQRLLGPTSGHELTLITCTPFWIDSDRLVWRAELIGG